MLLCPLCDSKLLEDSNTKHHVCSRKECIYDAPCELYDWIVTLTEPLKKNLKAIIHRHRSLQANVLLLSKMKGAQHFNTWIPGSGNEKKCGDCGAYGEESHHSKCDRGNLILYIETIVSDIERELSQDENN